MQDRLADNTMGISLSLSCILGAALMMAACSYGSMPSEAERSTSVAGGGQMVGTSSGARANAGWEASDSDWTATVRPLGDTGSTPSRELAGSEPVPAAGTADPGSAPAPIQTSQATVAASGGTSSAGVNPAVVSRLNTASAQARAGDYPRAAATLERAIAIEPGNAWLWHRLADTRLKEGRLQQAASLAAKSNSLAASDRSLQADNWRLIAEVRRRQGDAGAAAAAASEAARISN